LEDSNASLRREALYALENIAGDVLESKPANWMEWFSALPDQVTVDDDPLLTSDKSCRRVRREPEHFGGLR
jgi:hypothetical protein